MHFVSPPSCVWSMNWNKDNYRKQPLFGHSYTKSAPSWIRDNDKLQLKQNNNLNIIIIMYRLIMEAANLTHWEFLVNWQLPHDFG